MVRTASKTFIACVSPCTPPGLEAGAGERHVGVLPGGLEAALRVGRLAVAALRAERLGEPEQRPAVLRVLAQVVSVHGFGGRGAAKLEQRGADVVAHRVEPGRRLTVGQAVL